VTMLASQSIQKRVTERRMVTSHGGELRRSGGGVLAVLLRLERRPRSRARSCEAQSIHFRRWRRRVPERFALGRCAFAERPLRSSK
jgi:hypothetical protein